MHSRRICLQPFSWLELQPDGSLFGCCPSWRPQSLGNLLFQPLAEIWQAEGAKQLRQALRKGAFPGCRTSRCPHLATGSGPVRLQSELTAEDWQRLEEWETHGPDAFKLSFDLRCNLSCPSCRERLLPGGFDADRTGRLLQRVVAELLPVARTLILAGHGEPFAAPGYLQLLEELERGAAPGLRELHLHSNGLLWTPERWAGFPRLGELLRFVEISVDAACAATYAKNRRGGDFSILKENLAFIAGLNVEVQLSCVVQANNLDELEAFCDLAKSFGFRSYFSQLVNWGSFSRAEFVDRAVHLPAHPRYPELLTNLQRLSQRSAVSLGNLTSLLPHRS